MFSQIFRTISSLPDGKTFLISEIPNFFINFQLPWLPLSYDSIWWLYVNASTRLCRQLTWKQSKRWSSCSGEKSQASLARRSCTFFTMASCLPDWKIKHEFNCSFEIEQFFSKKNRTEIIKLVIFPFNCYFPLNTSVFALDFLHFLCLLSVFVIFRKMKRTETREERKERESGSESESELTCASHIRLRSSVVSVFSLIMKRMIFSSFSTYCGWCRLSLSTILKTLFSWIHSCENARGNFVKIAPNLPEIWALATTQQIQRTSSLYEIYSDD